MDIEIQNRPLMFHSVHGTNVRLFKNGQIAKRTESFCMGIAFSSRPIKVDEIVVMKIAETAGNWTGVLRVGLTNNEPSTFRNNLPKYACPEMTNKPGNWAKAVTERYCQQGNVLHFYLCSNGEAYYGVNGVTKGLFLSGIDTSLPLWVLVDIYGNSTAVEFMDPSEVPQLKSLPRSCPPALAPRPNTSSPLILSSNNGSGSPTGSLANANLINNLRASGGPEVMGSNPSSAGGDGQGSGTSFVTRLLRPLTGFTGERMAYVEIL